MSSNDQAKLALILLTIGRVVGRRSAESLGAFRFDTNADGDGLESIRITYTCQYTPVLGNPQKFDASESYSVIMLLGVKLDIDKWANERVDGLIRVAQWHLDAYRRAL